MTAQTIVLLMVMSLPGAAGSAAAVDDHARLIAEAESAAAAGQYGEAVEKFKEIIGEDPSSVRALVGLASLHATAQDPAYYDGQAAVQYALLALDQSPGDRRVIEVLAEGYFAQSQFERAVIELQRCIAASPEDPRLYKKLRRYALTWKGRQDIDLAGRDPSLRAKTFLYLGQAELRLGSHENAREHLQRAYELDASLPDLVFLLAEARMAAGDPGGAVELLRGDEGAVSGDPRYDRLLGDALAQAGDWEAAIARYRKVRDQQRDQPSLLLTLGRAYLSSGDHARALMMLNEAIEAQPAATFRDRRRRAEIELLAARALDALGEQEKALEMYYRSAAALDGGAEAEQRLRELFDEVHGKNLDPRRYFAGLDVVPWPDPVFYSNVSAAGVAEAPRFSGAEQGGVAWGDFDRDGDADLFVGGETLYLNEGRGRFKDVTEALGLAGLPNVAGGLFADTDGDGDLDLFLFCAKKGFRDRLMKNDGKLGFRQAADEQGGAWDVDSTAGGAFADFNGDGKVDLYLVNGAGAGAGGEAQPDAGGSQDALYINMGSGAFKKASEEAGIMMERPLNGSSVVIADYDGDGDHDVYAANAGCQPNLLWRNAWADSSAGPQIVRFAESAAAAGLQGREKYGQFGDSRGVAAGDVDNDGDMDFFVANVAPLLDLDCADKSQLFINSGRPDFEFKDVFDSSGIFYDERQDCPAMGDVDNDGDLDLFITARGAGSWSRLYINDGAGRYKDMTWIAGLAVEDALGGAFADYDRDGDLDLFINGEKGGLFENSGNANHWVGFQLRGAECNGSGIGARVMIDAGGRSQTRDVRGGRGCCQDDMAVHFGLGMYKGKVNVSVLWPNGRSAYIQNLRTDRYHTIEE